MMVLMFDPVGDLTSSLTTLYNDLNASLLFLAMDLIHFRNLENIICLKCFPSDKVGVPSSSKFHNLLRREQPVVGAVEGSVV